MGGVLRINQRVAVRPHRVGAPHHFAGVHVIGGRVAAHTEFTTRDTDDHLVLDRQHRRGVGLANRRIAIHGGPLDLAGLGIQCHHGCIRLMQEDLAIGIGHAPVDRVTAHDGDHVRVLLGLVFPDDLAVVVQVERINDVRKRRVDIHDVPDHQRRAFMPAQDAGRECPSDLQLAHIVLVDLVQPGIARVGIVAGLDRPLLGIGDLRLQIFIGHGHAGCADKERRRHQE